jgi:hypothetical protein
MMGLKRSEMRGPEMQGRYSKLAASVCGMSAPDFIRATGRHLCERRHL